MTPHTVERLHPKLPVFLVGAPGGSVLYVPGHAAPVSQATVPVLRESLRAEDLAHPLTASALHAAKAASAKWTALSSRDYRPECLTLYLSNHCTLACEYCYAAGPGGQRDKGWEGKRLPLLNPEAVRAAAAVVAENCVRIGKPFHLVLHGGGEPTLHWDLLTKLVTLVRTLAESCGLELWSYLSTGGVADPSKARWLARNINRVSLSADGPQDIHDLQRPSRAGGSSFAAVAATASALREEGVAFGVRSTITQRTVRRQSEILVALHHTLGAVDFTFEPAYQPEAGAAWALTGSEAAAIFVEHFLAAQSVATVLGCSLQTSGVRLDEIHGPFCNTLRQVLQVTPDGAAVSCFSCTDGTQPANAACCIGCWNASTGQFDLHQDRAALLRQQMLTVPVECEGCVNLYHCARGCPDACPSPELAATRYVGGFRCEVHRRLGEAWITRCLDAPTVAAEVPTQELDAFMECQSLLPSELSPAGPASLWARSRHRGLRPRAAPVPLWAERGFDIQGEKAWQTIATAASAPQSEPVSIYLHLPFCDRKCAFCDCYALLASGTSGETRMSDFGRALLREIESWGRLPNLRNRFVTTVHLGGGTPSYTPAPLFAEAMLRLRAAFGISHSTEWAIECTSTEITDEKLDFLESQGFTRLHVGVQTLHDPARRIAGRKEPGSVVKKKLLQAMERGWTVSADLIYGLPGQSPRQFLDSIIQLDDLGIHGLSLYKLNLTSRNRPFAEDLALDAMSPESQFFEYLLGESCLLARGYQKTHFAHFSRPQDRYLYYTHARRGEDLIALGPSADGSIGDWHYRHGDLPTYQRQAGSALLGTVRETQTDATVGQIVSGLMTANLRRSELADLPWLADLIEAWQAEGLLLPNNQMLTLSATGSWFLSDMLAELRAAAA